MQSALAPELRSPLLLLRAAFVAFQEARWGPAVIIFYVLDILLNRE